MVVLIIVSVLFVLLATAILIAFIHAHILIRRRPFTEFYNKRSSESDYCTFDLFPEHLIRITTLIEDSNFFSHKGINIRSIITMLLYDIKNRSFDFGASTITQQLVKNLYFGFYPSFYRKLREVFIAFSVEKHLSKQQIFELYLNSIYFDNGNYGITKAAKFYFDVMPSELSFNQCFILISLLPVVGIYNPLFHPDKFYKYMHNNAKANHSYGTISDEEMRIIDSHGPLCLDERICKADESLEKFSKHGPMINEKYGPFLEITDEEMLMICIVNGEACHANVVVHKAIANVIMNRIGTREWKNHKTISDVIKYTGFDSYTYKNNPFRIAEDYFKMRDGSNKSIEKLINEVLPVIRGEEKDITNGCILFYSPFRFFFNNLKYKRKICLKPNWNFGIIEKSRIKGCRGDYAFYRYIE